MTSRSGMFVGESEHHVQGEMLQIGSPAPDFVLLTPRYSQRTLANYEGKVKILSCIPSVDTGVCSAQTQRFNKEAADLGDDIVIVTVSADLPFALGRYCANEGIDKTFTLSTSVDMKFADDYGVHDTDWRICQRAVFVLDKQNIIQFAEYVPDMGNEVNFEAALNKARELI